MFLQVFKSQTDYSIGAFPRRRPVPSINKSTVSLSSKNYGHYHRPFALSLYRSSLSESIAVYSLLVLINWL